MTSKNLKKSTMPVDFDELVQLHTKIAILTIENKDLREVLTYLRKYLADTGLSILQDIDRVLKQRGPDGSAT